MSETFGPISCGLSKLADHPLSSANKLPQPHVLGRWQLKTCRACGVEKAGSKFSKHPGSADGRRSICNSCRAIQEHTRYHSPDYRKKALAAAKARKASRRDSFRANYLITAAKRRARERSIPFDLDQHKTSIQDRINAGACEMTGIAFDMKARSPFAPSLDRIVPEKGYVLSNTRVVIHSLNIMLHTWGEDHFLTVAKALIERKGK